MGRSGLTAAAALVLTAACHAAGRARIQDIEVSRSAGLVAYVKPTPQRLISTFLGEEQATELWIASADGSNARRLVQGAHSDSVTLMLADFSSPSISPDGRRVYFLSSAWVTSKAVHAVDIASGREWYVAPGNTLEVIPRGDFAGCLLVAQHRYRGDQRGSFDDIWLLGTDGREVSHVADDSESAERQLADWKRTNIPPETRSQLSPVTNAHCR